MFLVFIEKYFSLPRSKNVTFSLYVHETRSEDLEKIINFWSKKLRISRELVRVYWKRNVIVRKRNSPEYVGQISLHIKGERLLGSKLLAASDIILKKY